MMSDELYCTLHLDSHVTDDALVALVAEITAGTPRTRGVETTWARVHIGEDGGDFDHYQRDPDNFLTWALYIDFTPAPDVPRDTVLAGVSALSIALQARGMRVVAVGDDAETIPGYLP